MEFIKSNINSLFNGAFNPIRPESFTPPWKIFYQCQDAISAVSTTRPWEGAMVLAGGTLISSVTARDTEAKRNYTAERFTPKRIGLTLLLCLGGHYMLRPTGEVLSGEVMKNVVASSLVSTVDTLAISATLFNVFCKSEDDERNSWLTIALGSTWFVARAVDIGFGAGMADGLVRGTVEPVVQFWQQLPIH